MAIRVAMTARKRERGELIPVGGDENCDAGRRQNSAEYKRQQHLPTQSRGLFAAGFELPNGLDSGGIEKAAIVPSLQMLGSRSGASPSQRSPLMKN
jgi:hypothetical protein